MIVGIVGGDWPFEPELRAFVKSMIPREIVVDGLGEVPITVANTLDDYGIGRKLTWIDKEYLVECIDRLDIFCLYDAEGNAPDIVKYYTDNGLDKKVPITIHEAWVDGVLNPNWKTRHPNGKNPNAK